MTGDVNQLITWLSTNGLALAIGIVVIYLAYRWAQPAIHRLLVRIAAAQTTSADGDPMHAAEADKRIATIEDLLHRLLRVALGAALLVLFMGVFDLWPLLAGLGIVVAGITLAGQSIVLDYLMGFLILIEAQYFKGDIIRVGAVEGTVLEVGFRRTIIRDNRGIIHSISNGMIREAANLTRTYAVATIEIDGVADHDVETVIETLDEVGRSIAQDPVWAERILEPPAYAGTTRLSSYGATVRLRGRVTPESRTKVEAELRRRVAAALSAKGIVLIRAATIPTN